MKLVRGGSKYHAIATRVEGIRFASKLEAARYQQLKLWEKAGVVKWFIRQPRFDLPGGLVYVADFLVVFRCDGMLDKAERVEVSDCKGFQTQVFRMKLKLMRQAWPNVDLKLITKANVSWL